MASTLDFVEFVAGQITGAGLITFRKMFGEYAFYCNGKVVALICDNQFFAKPHPQIREFIGTVTEAPPYPGAKMHFLISDKLEDADWMSELIRISYNCLPEPAPKKPRKKKTK
ncbi:TfoX/Sxy family protein [Myxococcota bacterium]|nr:TfoX/Sxy family protein [Myxococcota bacterium]MBU1382123.1 TfoX/Sxy family protein [Myxococcota bacterium]MBU1498125.1 TfoX/Sxy family protein [Myxococcota bacterium]